MHSTVFETTQLAGRRARAELPLVPETSNFRWRAGVWLVMLDVS